MSEKFKLIPSIESIMPLLLEQYVGYEEQASIRVTNNREKMREDIFMPMARAYDAYLKQLEDTSNDGA
jgi:hypothetical protein